MRRLLFVLMIIGFAGYGMTGCKPGLLPTEGTGKPKVTLERVEIMRLVPWTELPAPTLLPLGFVFNIENPSGYNIKLENFKFAVYFEVPGRGENMVLSTATTYDTIYFPPKTTNQYRVVDILDSGAVWRSLMIPNRPKLEALNLYPKELTKQWFTTIGDFPFAIKAAEGMAVFSSEGVKGDIFVPFEGTFPKK